MTARLSRKAEEAAEEALRRLTGTIGRMRIVFYDLQDREIMTIGPYKCNPGEEMTITVPTPDSLKFGP